MTKRELADGVLLLKGFRNQDTKIDHRLIYWVADKIRAELINNSFKKSVKEDDFYGVGDFLGAYTATLKCDTVRGLDYCDLPKRLLNTINDAGLRQVGHIEDENSSFVIMKAGAVGMSSKLEVNKLGGETGVWLEGTKLFFHNQDQFLKEVLIKMVPMLDSIDEDETIPLAGALEARFVEMVTKGLDEAKMTPEDMYNDRRSKTA